MLKVILVHKVLQELRVHKVIKVLLDLVLKVLLVQEDQLVLKVLQESLVHKVHKDIKEILDLQEHKEMLAQGHIL